MKFCATVELGGKTATGIRVPDEIVNALAGGNRPSVRVTLAGHTYATSVARRRGEFKLPVSAAVREAAGIAAGDELDVEIELDHAPREVTIPGELGDALDRHPDAKRGFDLCPTRTANVTCWRSKAPRRPRLASGGSRRSSRSSAADAPCRGERRRVREPPRFAAQTNMAAKIHTWRSRALNCGRAHERRGDRRRVGEPPPPA